MATINPPKSAIGSPILHRLKVGSKSLKLSIYESSDNFTFFIGGHDLFCIDAMIDKPDSILADRGFDISQGYLSHIYYNINCSLNSNFERGIDTNMILLLLISYIKDNYNHIKTIRMTDTSSRVCDNGHSVELPLMYYIRTGKTWYESNFHAYMDEDDAIKFNREEEKFQNIKSSITWNNMKSYISEDMPLPEEEMHDLFESAKIWQDFFGPLSNRTGISKFCIFIAPWIHRFMGAFFRFNFGSAKYIIPLNKIPQLEYSITRYSRGGKKYTRKLWRSKAPKNET